MAQPETKPGVQRVQLDLAPVWVVFQSCGAPGIKDECLNQREPDLKPNLGTCQKCKFLGLAPDLLNQKLWGWGQHVCFESPLVD